jgi:hypothetical protein
MESEISSRVALKTCRDHLFVVPLKPYVEEEEENIRRQF